MIEYKETRRLQPGDVIAYEGQPHQVVDHPRRSRHFDFYLHVWLLNLDTREKTDATMLAFSRVPLLQGADHA